MKSENEASHADVMAPIRRLTKQNVKLKWTKSCKEAFKELPMEFAVEAQKLLGISLEGSVG